MGQSGITHVAVELDPDPAGHADAVRPTAPSHPGDPSPASRATVAWRSVAARAGVVAAFALAIELLSQVGWGWPLFLVMGGLSLTRLRSWGTSVLDRAVPLVWAWISVLVVLGWVGPFLPWLARPWFALVVLAAPYLARAGSPAGSWHVNGGAVREWTAAVLPAAVLMVPYVAHRSLGSLVTQLGIGWDTVNHLAVLRASLLSHGVTLYGPDPDRLLPSDLLDYPSGAHQVWAAWGQTAGLPGDGAADVMRMYPWLAMVTWMVLGASLVWVYRRLAPWARYRAWRDSGALVLLALGVTVAPLAGLWYSGFHNYAFAVAGVAVMMGLLVRAPSRPGAAVALSTALLVAVTTMYTLLLPLVAVGWLVVAWRALRAGGWAAARFLVLACVAAAVGLYPTVLPHLGGHEQLVNAPGMTGADLLVFTGGLVQVPFGVPLALAAVTLIGAVAWPPFRRRLAPTWALLAASVVLWVGVGAYTFLRTGMVGYYAEKVGYATLALLLPAAAAAFASCTLAWSTADRPGRVGRSRLVVAGVITAVAAVAVSIITLPVPRDPAGGIYTAPGASYLVHSLTEPDMTWVSGDRLVALAALSPRSHPVAVVPLSSFVGPTRLFTKPREAESMWADLLNPIDFSATRLLANLAAGNVKVPDVVCAVEVFARHHPDVPVRLVAADAAQAAQARTALRGCPVGQSTGPRAAVDIVIAPLPDPSWVLQAER